MYTGEWKASHALQGNPSYDHQTLTHKFNFVDPKIRIHTQNVEGLTTK